MRGEAVTQMCMVWTPLFGGHVSVMMDAENAWAGQDNP